MTVVTRQKDSEFYLQIHLSGVDIWSSVQTFNTYDEAKRELKERRIIKPNKRFRIMKETKEIITSRNILSD